MFERFAGISGFLLCVSFGDVPPPRRSTTTVSGPFESTIDPIVFQRKADALLSDPEYLARFSGEYQLGPQKIKVAVKGDKLTLSILGQPTYTLEPYKGTEFTLKGLQGFSVEFKLDEESGQASQAVFKQPNGVFTAKRL